jgi:hypothetical protein
VTGDFVSDFISLTEGVRSPLIFKKWTAISILAGAASRRLSVRNSGGEIFLNLYVVLVGPPGTGKYVIEVAKKLLSEVKEPQSKTSAFHLASDSITSATIVDELAKAQSTILPPKGPPIIFHSLFITEEEFQVLLPAYDNAIISKLNKLWNNSDVAYSESRRTGPVKEVSIELPQLNILAGAQPSYFSITFPEEAWSTGLARRVIMVYSNELIVKSFWEELEDKSDLRKLLVARLSQISSLYGSFQWNVAAAQKFDEWHLAGGQPTPTHSKLAGYLRTRSMFVVKLAMISSLSRGSDLKVEVPDVERAIDWLIEAEATMPDIFRAMLGKSDSQVIEELHLFALTAYAQKKKPLLGEVLRRFLLQRVPTEKAEFILGAAERANILARVAGTQDLYVPRPKQEVQVE